MQLVAGSGQGSGRSRLPRSISRFGLRSDVVRRPPRTRRRLLLRQAAPSCTRNTDAAAACCAIKFREQFPTETGRLRRLNIGRRGATPAGATGPGGHAPNTRTREGTPAGTAGLEEYPLNSNCGGNSSSSHRSWRRRAEHSQEGNNSGGGGRPRRLPLSSTTGGANSSKRRSCGGALNTRTREQLRRKPPDRRPPAELNYGGYFSSDRLALERRTEHPREGSNSSGETPGLRTTRRTRTTGAVPAVTAAFGAISVIAEGAKDGAPSTRRGVTPSGRLPANGDCLLNSQTRGSGQPARMRCGLLLRPGGRIEPPPQNGRKIRPTTSQKPARTMAEYRTCGAAGAKRAPRDCLYCGGSRIGSGRTPWAHVRVTCPCSTWNTRFGVPNRWASGLRDVSTSCERSCTTWSMNRRR